MLPLEPHVQWDSASVNLCICSIVTCCISNMAPFAPIFSCPCATVAWVVERDERDVSRSDMHTRPRSVNIVYDVDSRMATQDTGMTSYRVKANSVEREVVPGSTCSNFISTAQQMLDCYR